MNRYQSALLSLLVAASALVLPVAAASAAPAPNNYGSTVNCRHQVTQEGKYGWTEAILKKIVVKSPTIYAKSGTQQVGWQFVVRRNLDRNSPSWVVTYRSHIQQRLATTTTPADFDAMRIGVNVPIDDEGEYSGFYKVTLKVFWYASDGSVASKTSTLLTEYFIHVDGETGGADEFCQGMARQWFDGPRAADLGPGSAQARQFGHDR